MAWARAHLQFNDIATAERALSGNEERTGNATGYHASLHLSRTPDEKKTRQTRDGLKARLQLSARGKALSTSVRHVRLPFKQRRSTCEASDFDRACAATQSNELGNASAIVDEPRGTKIQSCSNCARTPVHTLRHIERIAFISDLLHQFTTRSLFLSYRSETNARGATCQACGADRVDEPEQFEFAALDFLKRCAIRWTLEKWPVPWLWPICNKSASERLAPN